MLSLNSSRNIPVNTSPYFGNELAIKPIGPLKNAAMPPTSGIVAMTGGDLNGFSTTWDNPSRMNTRASIASNAMGTSARGGTPIADAMASTLSIIEAVEVTSHEERRAREWRPAEVWWLLSGTQMACRVISQISTLFAHTWLILFLDETNTMRSALISPRTFLQIVRTLRLARTWLHFEARVHRALGTATTAMPVVVAMSRWVSAVPGGMAARHDGGVGARRASLASSSSFRVVFGTAPKRLLSSPPVLGLRRTRVPNAIAVSAAPAPPSCIAPRTQPFTPMPRRRDTESRNTRVERCVKCDAVGGNSLRSNLRECCRRAAGLGDEPGSAGRVALGAACVGGAATAAYVAYGGSGGGGNGGMGGGKGFGGGGGGGFYESGSKLRAASSSSAATPSSGVVEEVVLLDVRGMHCGGCTANVKRILEMEENCVSASVNLANESALVRVAVDVGSFGLDTKNVQNGDAWMERQIVTAVRAAGDALATTVTSKGFPTTVREACGVAVSGVSASDAANAKREARLQRIQESTKRVVVAWALAATCLLGHAAHMFSHQASWLKVLCSTPVHAGLSVFALLGPGRETLVDGWRAIRSGGPNMNTLVSLGALASFGMSAAAVALPKLGWPTFFEEPVMLLAFVLLGRAVEERAKLRATSDMIALLNLLPATARLVGSGGVAGDDGNDHGDPSKNAYFREVPTSVLVPDDLILVLPGDRIPVDGVVWKGASQVDEAAINGEPIPNPKTAGDAVSAGTVNCDGALTVRVVNSGNETQVANIVRMVEAAQQREAPVQRLADEGTCCAFPKSDTPPVLSLTRL